MFPDLITQEMTSEELEPSKINNLVPETPRIFIYISCIGDESTTLVQ
jgi:hypothetical protein